MGARPALLFPRVDGTESKKDSSIQDASKNGSLLIFYFFSLPLPLVSLLEFFTTVSKRI